MIGVIEYEDKSVTVLNISDISFQTSIKETTDGNKVEYKIFVSSCPGTSKTIITDDLHHITLQGNEKVKMHVVENRGCVTELAPVYPQGLFVYCHNSGFSIDNRHMAYGGGFSLVVQLPEVPKPKVICRFN